MAAAASSCMLGSPNHVVIVHWVENTLTVLVQVPVPHAGRTEGRGLFVDYRPAGSFFWKPSGSPGASPGRTSGPEPF